MDDHIYMDAMGFGMGNSCLQVTFQASSISEGKHLYDQLLPLTPILLALSAASPVFRGVLSDVDTRWAVISASVDCRTDEERGEIPLKNDRFIIPKVLDLHHIILYQNIKSIKYRAVLHGVQKFTESFFVVNGQQVQLPKFSTFVRIDPQKIQNFLIFHLKFW